MPGPSRTLQREIGLAESIIVIACSGAKRAGDVDRTLESVLDYLPRDLARELTDRRRRNEEAAGIDESTLWRLST